MNKIILAPCKKRFFYFFSLRWFRDNQRFVNVSRFSVVWKLGDLCCARHVTGKLYKRWNNVY